MPPPELWAKSHGNKRVHQAAQITLKADELKKLDQVQNLVYAFQSSRKWNTPEELFIWTLWFLFFIF